ncbi:MAG: ComEC/Rec2 family competence protein [Terriglobales bacterium]
MHGLGSTCAPLLWAALAYAGGIALGVYTWRPSLWWVVAALVFLAGAVCFRTEQGWRNQVAWGLAVAAFVALGAWSIQGRRALPPPTGLGQFVGEEVEVIAHVAHDGVIHGRAPHLRQSVDLETEQIVADGVATEITAGVRLSVYQRIGPAAEDGGAPDAEPAAEDTALPPVFTYGQRLRFPVKLRTPRNFGNPGAWDYRGYLAKQGIVATGAVAAGKIELLPGTAGSRFGLLRSRARRSVLEKIHALWPRDEAALLDAMLISERSLIARDTSTAWQRTGIYHILVVSGMNVALLAFPVFWLLRRFRAGDVLATALTVLLSAAYAYLADSGAPILRAVLMLSVFLVARLFFRPHALLNAIGVSALVLLVADPRALFEPSFQLTFLSVLAIAGLAVPLLERTSDPYRRGLRWLFSPAYDLTLPSRVAQFRLDLRMLVDHLLALTPWSRRVTAPTLPARIVGRTLVLCVLAPMYAFDTAAVSALAQLAMALPMAWYFHRAVAVGLPANLLAVPLTGLLMPAAALALVLSYVWLPLAKAPATVAAYCLSGVTSVVRTFAALPVADLRIPTPTITVAVAAATALALALVLMRRRAAVAAFGTAALIAGSLWLGLVVPRPQFTPGALELTAIDVGQAESMLVVTPEGRTLLVDAAGTLGPFPSEFDFGEDVIAPYLWSRRFSRLDVLILTHAHADHMGGMPALIAAFRPRELWLGPNAETPALQQLLRTAEAHQVAVVRRNVGERIAFGGATFEVLAPPPGWQVKPKPRNEDSLVLRVSLGQTAALLTADADKKIERYLAAQAPRADLLKVAHNGSATSTTPQLLEAVRPRFAVISVGAHNSFGHPRREVLERLAQARVATYRTDTMGAISFVLDGKTVTAKPAALR